MAGTYVEEYAKRCGISVAEAMEHAVVKEYLKYHPQDRKEVGRVVKTQITAGCGSAGEVRE